MSSLCLRVGLHLRLCIFLGLTRCFSRLSPFYDLVLGVVAASGTICRSGLLYDSFDGENSSAYTVINTR